MASILDTLIDITFEGRTLQLRPNQLTVDTISRAFRLIPETILLISDRGTIAVPQEGEFSDVDELYSWAVEGDKVTTHSNMRNTHRDRPQSAAVPVTAVAKWKPPQASRPKSNGLPSGHGSWNKSIEICYLRGSDVTQTSEHPVTLDESSANVSTIQGKVSKEAFSGARVKLLNAKNILIADVEGTRGSKFWHTNKIIRAISEVDYKKLEMLRNGEARPSEPGPSRSGEPGPSTSVVHVNLVSDSSSEDLHQLFGKGKKKRKRKYFVPPPPNATDSEEFSTTSSISPPPSKFRATVDVKNLLLEIKDDLKSKGKKTAGSLLKKTTIADIFTCIICKELAVEEKNPIMPSCCSSLLCCKQCLEQWLDTSGGCPHCRRPITMDDCVVQPLIKPLFELVHNHSGTKD